MLKKIALVLVVLLIALGAGGYYLWSHLDSFVIAAVEEYGSAATQTKVTLAHFDLSPRTGEGSLGDLTVGVPSGFTVSKSLFLGTVKIAVDTSSVSGNGPIVIRSVLIDKPQITYELANSGDSNLQAILRNTQSYASAHKSESGKPVSPPPASTETGKTVPARKVIIDDLVISNGQISIAQNLLQGKQLDAPLPTMHLTNIGKNEGGATPAEITNLLLTTIAETAAKVAETALTQQLGNIQGLVGSKLGDKLKGQLGDKLNGQLKGLLGN